MDELRESVALSPAKTPNSTVTTPTPTSGPTRNK